MSVQARYSETMDPAGLTKNLAEFGIVDDGAEANQSATFQKAIDNLAALGGGRLVIPKGSYRLAKV